ncbi:MAG: flagellar motor switch protein FliN [candidate division WS1 bacterium]|nr:flagellar motor switch protein FliN [candidate division WS1 bacterium]
MPETVSPAEDVGPEAPDSGQTEEQVQDGDPAVHRLHPGEPAGWQNLQRMLDVPLSLTVVLGSTELPLSEVFALEAGSVISIDRLPGEPIDLLINDRLFARGEVVVINETFGYRITELVDGGSPAGAMRADGGRF